MTPLGHPWFLNLPSGWEVRPFKRMGHVRTGQVDPREYPYSELPLYAPNHIEPATGRLLGVETAAEQGADSGKYPVRSGEVVYSKIRPALRKLIIAPKDGLCSADMYAISPVRGVSARFLFWAMLSEGFSSAATLASDRVAMPKVNRDTLADFPLPHPPLATQKAIAAFLDRKTAAIDALIARKQRLLDLLAEKRAALINQVVIKGLDPTVPMKDSGIPWFGEIPAHWEVMQVRRVVRRIEQGWSPSCENRLAEPGEWGVLKVGCVNGGRFRSDEHKALPFDLRPDARLEIRPGDLLMSRANTRELVGSTAVVVESRRRLLLCDKLYRIRLQEERCRPTFFSLAMASAALRTQFEATSSGASSSMQNIGQEKLASFQMAVPPLAEQSAMESSLATSHAASMVIESKLRDHIERLQEYRQALITAAVTGQIDIPEEATA